jgi:Zn-dependent protease with chaperone function
VTNGKAVARSAAETQVSMPTTNGTSANGKAAKGTTRPADLQHEILTALCGEIPKVRTTIFYRFAALIVAAVMIVLPLLYVLLICAAAYGVYYHAVNHVGMLEHGRGRGAIMVFLIYMAPIVCGAILVFFMVKPLFAPPGHESRRRNLTAKGEPILFATVERLCQIVGAPVPKRIDVNCDINASAGFRRGFWSVFLGSDLALTIGIPLVESLSMRQLLGVLAHEFGHFTQGAGMRLTFLIRSINHWFARVVYQRDAWDEWLAATAGELDLRIGWILYLSMMCVFISRGILWLFMVVGNFVSGLMLRQMEFDADKYEIRLAGSTAFEATARELALLQVAHQGALHDLLGFLKKGDLPDNLSRLIGNNIVAIPPNVQYKIRKAQDDAKTGVFDTHPSDAQRISAARKENAPGIFPLERPARELFMHYEALAKNVTWDLYCDLLGPGINPKSMKSIEELRQPSAEDQRREEESATPIPLE